MQTQLKINTNLSHLELNSQNALAKLLKSY
jgi:hypothetical protein